MSNPQDEQTCLFSELLFCAGYKKPHSCISIPNMTFLPPSLNFYQHKFLRSDQNPNSQIQITIPQLQLSGLGIQSQISLPPGWDIRCMCSESQVSILYKDINLEQARIPTLHCRLSLSVIHIVFFLGSLFCVIIVSFISAYPIILIEWSTCPPSPSISFF